MPQGTPLVPNVLLATVVVLSLAAARGSRAAEADDPRTSALLGKMTLEEKVGQMTLYQNGVKDQEARLLRAGISALQNVRDAKKANAIQRVVLEKTRLKIPILFAEDVIHGFRTIFPIPMAEAGTFEPEIAERTAAAAAREASAVGIRWSFAPMVDIYRDARWGRGGEGSGEDKFLGMAMAAARVRGFQGATLGRSGRVLASVKHFAGYGGVEGGRDYNTVDLSEHALRDVHLPPFKSAVDAGVGAVMTAYTELAGVPPTGDERLLGGILRGEWGFRGFVVSDWASIVEMLSHGFVATEEEAVIAAMKAGVDMDLQGDVYDKHLPRLVREGKVPMESVDASVRRILHAKVVLGLFDNPYVDESLPAKLLVSEEHKQVALEAARASIVLLKNEGKVLPLRRDLRTIGVIGPLADDRKATMGFWTADGKAEDVVTVLDGIRLSVLPSTKVLHAKGVDLAGSRWDGAAEAVAVAQAADAVVLVMGEDGDLSGEAHSRSSIDLPGRQRDLVKTILDTKKPVVLVLMNGRPLTIDWEADNVPAIVETWFLGTMAGQATADVLFGLHNPGAKLTVSFPRRVGQIPIYYNHKNTGRPDNGNHYSSRYDDLPSTPLFPFGFGLSYTEFTYSDLRLSAAAIPPEGTLRVSVDVANVGSRGGHEVAQLYIRDLAASRTRPVRELAGFRRLWLEPGEKKTVELTLSREQLGLWNSRTQFVVEPGAFKLWVGGSSVGGLEADFQVVAGD